MATTPRFSPKPDLSEMLRASQNGAADQTTGQPQDSQRKDAQMIIENQAPLPATRQGLQQVSPDMISRMPRRLQRITRDDLAVMTAEAIKGVVGAGLIQQVSTAAVEEAVMLLLQTAGPIQVAIQAGVVGDAELAELMALRLRGVHWIGTLADAVAERIVEALKRGQRRW